MTCPPGIFPVGKAFSREAADAVKHRTLATGRFFKYALLLKIRVNSSLGPSKLHPTGSLLSSSSIEVEIFEVPFLGI